MALIRQIIYQVDSSQLKASDAEIARSEEKLNGLLRERETLANRRASGGGSESVEAQRALIQQVTAVNAAIKRQQGVLTQAQTAQSEYGQGIERTSNLLREFAGITYDGQFWRDANDGLMSPGEVAAVVSEYKDMERVLEKIAGISFDNTAGPNGAGAFVRTGTNVEVSSEDVQNARDMVASLAESDAATGSVVNLSGSLSSLRNELTPATGAGNALGTVLDNVAERALEAAVAHRAQARAAGTAATGMGTARAAALALRAALGGIVLQALILFLTAGVSALNKMRDAQREAAGAAREHKQEILDLIEATRRLAATEAYAGQQRLSNRREEEEQRRDLAARGLNLLRDVTVVGGAGDAEFVQLNNVNKVLIDQLETRELITAEQAELLRGGAFVRRNAADIQTGLTDAFNAGVQGVQRLTAAQLELRQQNENNPFYQIGEITAQRDVLRGQGVADSPELRRLNAELQRVQERLDAAGEVGQIDRSAERRDARQAERDRLQAQKDALQAEKDLEERRLSNATTTADRVSAGVEVETRATREGLLLRAQLREDDLAGQQATENARIALITDTSQRVREQAESDERFQEQLAAAEMQRIQDIYDLDVRAANDGLAAVRRRAPSAYENPVERAAAIAEAEDENTEARAAAVRTKQLDESRIALEGIEFRLRQEAEGQQERIRIHEEGNATLTEQTQDYLESERGLLDQAAVQESLINEGRIVSQQMVAAGLQDLKQAMQATTGEEERAALQVLIDRFQRLGAVIQETTRQAARTRADKLIEDLDVSIKLADELGAALREAGLGFVASITDGLGSALASVRNAASVNRSVGQGAPGFTGTAGALAQAGAYAGAAGAIAGAVGGFVSALEARAERERALQQAVSESALAVQRNTDALLSGQIGADYTRAQIDASATAIEGLEQLDVFSFLRRGQISGNQEVADNALNSLESTGVNVDDLRDRFTAAINARDFEAFQAALDDLRRRFEGLGEGLGTFSNDLRGRLAEFSTRVELLGLEGQEAFREFLRLVRSSSEDLGDLDDVLARLDGATPEQAAEIIRAALEQVTTPDAFDFGGLTPDQVIQALRDALRVSGAEQGGQSGTSTVRTITESTASEMLAYSQEGLRAQRRIADGVDISNLLLERISGNLAPGASQAGPAEAKGSAGDDSRVTVHAPVTVGASRTPEEIGRIAGQEIERQVRSARLRGQGGRTSKG